jgi:hypothetical protein
MRGPWEADVDDVTSADDRLEPKPPDDRHCYNSQDVFNDQTGYVSLHFSLRSFFLHMRMSWFGREATSIAERMAVERGAP